MKTTVEIPNSLLADAKRVAAREGTTVKALIEEGLRRTLAERNSPGQFRLRDGSFQGDGLCPEVSGGSWERIRDLIYEAHGA